MLTWLCDLMDKNSYQPPLLEIVEVRVEAGFAVTGDIEGFDRSEWDAPSGDE